LTIYRRPRARHVRILATLGPASATVETIGALYDAGADAFRINMSHGDAAGRRAMFDAIRSLEASRHRPMTILADLQGPKLRVGRFAAGSALLQPGQTFILDLDPTPGDEGRVQLPHPEIFACVGAGHRLLLDDGRIVLTVREADVDRLVTQVTVPGILSNNKGVNVPDVVVPLPALTPKDRQDLADALDMGVDWIALSFVQRPEDLAEARRLIGARASLMAKIEKPSALSSIDGIIEMADAIMVARGDLGVELPPEDVPASQKKLVGAARRAGKPVVVATQMLESMIHSPTPTRAEVSDVANAIYDGADCVMLSAESAAGDWPVEAVRMMDKIAIAVEADDAYAGQMAFVETRPEPTTADALCEAARAIQRTIGTAAVVCFTSSGLTAARIARERIPVVTLAMTPRMAAARRLGLVWGVHAIHTREIGSFEEMVAKSRRMALRHKVAAGGDRLAVIAGVPFGQRGSTNVLHVARLVGDELTRR
jgi:pyruvate kinase